MVSLAELWRDCGVQPARGGRPLPGGDRRRPHRRRPLAGGRRPARRRCAPRRWPSSPARGRCSRSPCPRPSSSRASSPSASGSRWPRSTAPPRPGPLRRARGPRRVARRPASRRASAPRRSPSTTPPTRPRSRICARSCWRPSPRSPPRAARSPSTPPSPASCSTPQQLDPEYWYRNLRQTGAPRAGLPSLLEQGTATFVEIGPHPVFASPQEDDRGRPRATHSRPACSPALRRDEGGPERFALSLARPTPPGPSSTGRPSSRAPAPSACPCPPTPSSERYWLDCLLGGSDPSAIGQAAAEHPLLGAERQSPSAAHHRHRAPLPAEPPVAGRPPRRRRRSLPRHRLLRAGAPREQLHWAREELRDAAGAPDLAGAWSA